MKKSLLYVGALMSVFVPYLATAQALNLTSASTFFATIATFIQSIIGLLIGVAVLIIVYGVVTFIASGDDAAARKSGAAFMAYGIVGIFVIVSIWGLVGFLTGSVSFGTTTVVTPPAVPSSGSN